MNGTVRSTREINNTVATSARGAGFTLVELLVVIGIIALLISILLPSLSRARESANQIKCGAQQRQILQSMQLHANDHRGFIPMAGYIQTTGTGPADVGDTRMQHYAYYGTPPHITSLPAGLAIYLGQEIDFSTKASLEKGIQGGVVRKLFVCPSDREGGRFGATVNEGGDHYNSYAFNEAALGWSTLGSRGADPAVRGHSRLHGHVARFPHPSQLMLLTDGAPRGGDGPGNWQVYYDHDTNCTLGDAYRELGAPKDCGAAALLDKNRHRGRMNVGFADSHVENVPIALGDLDKISLDLDFPSN